MRTFPRLPMRGCAVAFLLLGVFCATAGQARDEHGPRVIVKLAGEGAHAVEACAQEVFERGGRFERVSADGSDSLDRLHARHGVRRIRALLRDSDGRPLREQRAALRERLAPRKHGARVMRSGRQGVAPAEADVPDLGHVYLVEAGADAQVERLIEDYSSDPHVVWAQRDHAHVLDAIPDDTYYLSSGAWGQEYLDLWGLHRIRAPEAWQISRGEGIVVAVVDSGIDYEHPDIADNVWVNPGEDLGGDGRADPEDWNGVDDDGNGFIDDLHGFDFANSVDADGDGRFDGPDDVNDSDPYDDRGHGTHVAGTIAAVANNGIGIVGVAPGAKVMAIKGFAASGPGRDSDLWRGVLYAAANGATVINNSWSCGIPCPSNPLAEEVVGLLAARGVVIVTSAGNRSSDVVHNSPENRREVITVASSGEDEKPSATFTNFGWAVDLSAPGGGPFVSTPTVSRRNILSLRSSGINEVEDAFRVGDAYLRWAGTSMSAPHVAGVVALLQSARPELDYEGVRRVLRESAIDTGPPGFDAEMGAGRLDALAALEYDGPADLEALIDSPRPRDVISPDASPLEVRGIAAGADFASYDLSWGRGASPAIWTSIVGGAQTPVENGPLAAWDVGDLAPGAYVLRLEVHGVAGELYEEYVQLSLERTSVTQLSSMGPPAERPSLSGDLVVWHSKRDPGSESGEAEDWNLFATRLSSGREWPLQIAPGDQSDAHASGGIVAWLDGRADEQDEMDVYACALQAPDGACNALPVATGPRPKLSPGAVAGRVIWQDQLGSGSDLASCRMRSRGEACEPSDLGLPEANRFLLGLGEREIAWFEGPQGRVVASCTVDPSSGECPARALLEGLLPVAAPVVDADLLVYGELQGAGIDLHVCEIDAATGACPAVRVRRGIGDETPRLSGNRLVWHESPRGQASDVFLCEYDRVRRRCPVQRVTSEMSAQLAADVSGDWIVWQDHRLGSAQIFGAQMPSLRALRDRRVREGSPLWIPIRASHEGGAALGLSLEVEGVADPSELGMQLVDAGEGRGSFRWRPGFDQAGEYVVTIAASAEAGLTTRQSVRIEVSEANARPRIVLDAPGVVAVGEAAVLDACSSFDPDGDPLAFSWQELPVGRGGDARVAAAADTIGLDCRLEIAASQHIALRRFRLRVSDGMAEARRTAAVVWLPEWWLRWWRARR